MEFTFLLLTKAFKTCSSLGILCIVSSGGHCYSVDEEMPAVPGLLSLEEIKKEVETADLGEKLVAIIEELLVNWQQYHA